MKYVVYDALENIEVGTVITDTRKGEPGDHGIVVQEAIDRLGLTRCAVAYRRDDRVSP